MKAPYRHNQHLASRVTPNRLIRAQMCILFTTASIRATRHDENLQVNHSCKPLQQNQRRRLRRILRNVRRLFIALAMTKILFGNNSSHSNSNKVHKLPNATMWHHLSNPTKGQVDKSNRHRRYLTFPADNKSGNLLTCSKIIGRSRSNNYRKLNQRLPYHSIRRLIHSPVYPIRP